MQDLSKYKTPINFRGRSKFIVQLWWVIQAVFVKPSPQLMYGWRRCLLRLFGAQIGKNVIIRPSVSITYPWKVKIGDNSWIGDDVVLYSLGEIFIGNNTVVSQKSYICTGSHDHSKIDFPIYAKKIIIEDECWLATDVYVGPGVTIGKGTVVGARSSVFKNLPKGKICIGSPAKVIKRRNIEY
ncbi:MULTISPECIES: putative colanic acid biosynthesis acetyltransferase [unclassified Cellulophaga]|uniref:putative colanic acid biosynthesis acetyltransferase n=1 Tax=unclassified Cellulophaga TaxID=2634405 RepID=UPI0026E27FB1|nr:MULTISPECIES: putative colanic acid biosynthesis acetyltransferase [unclassified Cellulophaga]MDO6489764.1 putative colanic acid biosynthesis acetyltransferase [Cellulophaga sp. 2_MG-2023]MDO6495042.1 putative colanic acid biosynthesis acetyltransferase [Cellulophaga sp. 3_MG-2023]